MYYIIDGVFLYVPCLRGFDFSHDFIVHFITYPGTEVVPEVTHPCVDDVLMGYDVNHTGW